MHGFGAVQRFVFKKLFKTIFFAPNTGLRTSCSKSERRKSGRGHL